jgi:hypothetical protein
MTEWINLREERDFGEKFNATFLFARQNFKSVSLCLLYLGAPLMIVASLFVAYMQADMQIGTIDYSKGLPEGIGILYLVIVPVYLIAYSWLMTVTYSYITEYLNGNREITPAQVFSRASHKIGKIIVLNIITGIMIFFALILLVIPGIYLAVALTFVQVILVVEDVPVFKSISRSMSLIKEKWWSTFGLVFVMSIVLAIMQLIFAIPTYISLFFKALHQNLFAFDAGTIISNMIAAIGISLLYPLLFVAIAFQYFNMVERHEGKGLMNEIDLAGKQPETTFKNEGEY